MNSQSSGSRLSTTGVRLLAATVFIFVAGLILLFVISHEQWLAMNEQELVNQRNIKLPSELLTQQVREDSLLGSSELLDSASATYRIPIERAMELIEAEATK